MLQVIRARKAGFCMGVAMALRKLDEAVDARPCGRVATLGEIIHNPQVLEEYAARGVSCLRSPEEALPGQVVLIRAHGVPRDTEAALRSRGVIVIDATCPRVKAAQLAIAEATAGGLPLLLYGEAEHPEVKGLLSYAHGHRHVFGNVEELARYLAGLEQGTDIVLAAQTTQDRRQFETLRAELDQHMDTSVRVLDTICDATRQRQEEAQELSDRVDAMVVVGGRSSGNTRRLAELAARRVPAFLVETAEELEPEKFAGFSVIGLTAGASTPKRLVNAVEKRLSEF